MNDLKAYWKGRTALCTGGAGMCGSHLCDELQAAGARVVVADDLSSGKREWIATGTTLIQVDLREPSMAAGLLNYFRPDVLFHLAARVSGIGYNERNHARMLLDNGLLQLSMLEALTRRPIRAVIFSTACVLPPDAPVPTPETADMGTGPEPTNKSYGWSKRIGEIVSLDLLREDSRQSILTIRPWNMYSERDHFNDPDAHVIPALVAKMVRGDKEILCRGTGQAQRSFIHALDVARAVMLAEATGATGLLHVGGAEEVTIRELVSMIASAAGWTGRLEFDRVSSDGYPRRLAEMTLLRSIVPGWTQKIGLADGLQRVAIACRDWARLALELRSQANCDSNRSERRSLA